MAFRGIRSAKLRRSALSVLAMLVAAGGPAAADWLVYQDGTRLETAGEWQVKGRLVVFSLPNGTLSAVKADELDLDASRELTREPAPSIARQRESQPVTEKKSPPRKARIVITDADVGHVDPSRSEASPVAEPAEPADVAPKPGLEITKWGRSEPDENGILIVGHLRNVSDRASAAVTVTVRALAENDAVLLEQAATLERTTLMPGQSTRFEALLNQVFSFEEVKFETSSIDLEVAGPDNESSG